MTRCGGAGGRARAPEGTGRKGLARFPNILAAATRRRRERHEWRRVQELGVGPAGISPRAAGAGWLLYLAINLEY